MGKELNCSTCGDSFAHKASLSRHTRKKHRIPCDKCSEAFPTLSAMRRHRRKCETQDSPSATSEQLLPSILSEYDEPENLSDEEYISDNEESEEMADLYRHNWGAIRTHQVYRRNTSYYNWRIDTDPHTLLTSDQIWMMFDKARTKFKINASLGCALYNQEDDKLRYWHASPNSGRLFQHPRIIENADQFANFLSEAADFDFLEQAIRKRPNTKWVVSKITNITFYLYHIPEHPAGCVTQLPDYLNKDKSLIALVKSTRGVPYRDNLCLFRCLAWHRNGRLCLETKAQKLFKQFAATQNIKNLASFRGVSMKKLTMIEDLWSVAINVYTKEADGTVSLVRRSPRRYKNIMYLNLFNNHYSYIKNMKLYSKSYKCSCCDKLFRTHYALYRHTPCPLKQSFTYPSGAYTTSKNVLQKLEEYGIAIPDKLKYYRYRACYDCECYLSATDLPKSTKSTVWNSEHKLASVSVCSNVESYDQPKCFVNNGDEYQLVSDVMDYLEEISRAASDTLFAEFSEIYSKIKMLEQTMDIMERLAVSKSGSDPGSSKQNPLIRLREQLDEYITQLPVFGFNSGKYDLPILSKHIIKYYVDRGARKSLAVIKNGNNYKVMKTQALIFLDISNYLAAGSSFAGYLKAYKAEGRKFWFPYEYFDSLDVLKEKELPPHSAFYSSVTRKNITDEEYKICQETWASQGMRSVKDFLIYYNNRDVGPFIEALDKQISFYKTQGLDMAKDGMSIPGLAMKCLMKNIEGTDTMFSLFGFKHKDLYHAIRKNIRGGLSMVFHRYHEAGVTKIRERARGPEAKLCESCVGFDVSGMYLNNLTSPQPTGHFIRRRADNSFRAERASGLSVVAAEWMEWIASTENITITHQFRAQEVKLGLRLLPMDGFARDTPMGQTAFSMLGCYFHSHPNCIYSGKGKHNDDYKNACNYKNTLQNLEYIRELGYTMRYIWECEWNAMKRTNAEIAKFVKELQLLPDDRFQLSQQTILKEVENGKLFGIVECDIRLPKDMESYFSEFQPVIKHADVSRDDIGECMKLFAESEGLLKRPNKMLVCSYFAKKIMLATPLLQWYLKKGLVVEKIHQTIQYTPKRCFIPFGEQVMQARREGDSDPDKGIVSESSKLIGLCKISAPELIIEIVYIFTAVHTLGNSAYGRCLIRKEDYTEVKYFDKDEQAATDAINRPTFIHFEELDTDVIEVEKTKNRVKLDVPIQIGFFILEYAKLTLLRFYYDFLMKYVRRKDFQLIQADTDSMYLALSGNSLFSIVRLQLRKEFIDDYENWFAKQYCSQHKKDFFACQFKGDDWELEDCCKRVAMFDKRTVGKFHMEWNGEGVVALCSKTYWCIGDKSKYSSKGLSKRHNSFTAQHYKDVLFNTNTGSGVNKGFRIKNNNMYTYTQTRKGLSYLYAKRIVCDDGVSTLPTLV